MASRLKACFKILVGVGLVGAMSSLVVLPLFADFSVQSWHFVKPVVLPAGLSQESLVEVVPDLEVFAHAAPGLSDLRVIEGDSHQEVSYKLLVERGEQRRGSIAVTVLDLGHLPGQHTSFVADLGQGGVLHNELEIRTTSQNFQRRVVVEGSPDSETWMVLQEQGQIFDFTVIERNFTTHDTRVQYPPSTARYLRIRVINDEEPPLEITGAVAYFTQELAPKETELRATLISREEETGERKTLLVLDIGNQGFPSNRLSFVIPRENFYRAVRLEGSNDVEIWSTVQNSETLYSYNTPKFVGSKLSLSYPEATFRYFRLTIFNEDNAPLPVASATIHGILRKLIFSASPGGNYQIYYGNAEARAPSYELERIFPYLVTENLPVAQLGAHKANPLFVPPPEPALPPKPFTERYPWLLPTAVAGAALLIGLFLANLLRQVRKLLPPPPSS